MIRLRELRTSRGLTQRHLAIAAKDSGFATGKDVSDLERAKLWCFSKSRLTDFLRGCAKKLEWSGEPEELMDVLQEDGTVLVSGAERIRKHYREEGDADGR